MPRSAFIHQLFCVMHDMDFSGRLASRACTLEVFRVSPKRETCPFIFGFIQQFFFFFYILKTKSMNEWE